MTFVFAEIGVTSIYLLFGWLAFSIVAGWLAQRKGYEEKYGLAAGMVFSFLAVLALLVWPARPGSDWKVLGPFGRRARPERG